MKAWVHIEEIGEVSFDEIFRKFYRSMCSCATHFLKDHDAAEDIVQEVFVSLWTKKSVFRTMSDLKTFLYVSVKNRCLNYIRDRKQQVDYDALSESEQEEEFKDWLISDDPKYTGGEFQLKYYVFGYDSDDFVDSCDEMKIKVMGYTPIFSWVMQG